MADEGTCDKLECAFQMSSKRCFLLELPSELRLMIYRHVFDGGVQFDARCYMREPKIRIYRYPKWQKSAPKAVDFCLLPTCRQIYSELQEWLKDHHIINIEATDRSIDDDSASAFRAIQLPAFFTTFRLTILVDWRNVVSDEDAHELFVALCEKNAGELIKLFETFWRQLAAFVSIHDGCRLTKVRCKVWESYIHGTDFVPYFRGFSILGLQCPVVILFDKYESLWPEEILVHAEKTAAVRTMLSNAENCR